MGIVAPVARVMSANFNALIDKADDPRKSLDQTCSRCASRSRPRAAKWSAALLPKKKVEELDREVGKWNGRAELAVPNNDDGFRLTTQSTGVQLHPIVGKRGVRYLDCTEVDALRVRGQRSNRKKFGLRNLASVSRLQAVGGATWSRGGYFRRSLR